MGRRDVSVGARRCCCSCCSTSLELSLVGRSAGRRRRRRRRSVSVSLQPADGHHLRPCPSPSCRSTSRPSSTSRPARSSTGGCSPSRAMSARAMSVSPRPETRPGWLPSEPIHSPPSLPFLWGLMDLSTSRAEEHTRSAALSETVSQTVRAWPALGWPAEGDHALAGRRSSPGTSSTGSMPPTDRPTRLRRRADSPRSGPLPPSPRLQATKQRRSPSNYSAGTSTSSTRFSSQTTPVHSPPPRSASPRPRMGLGARAANEVRSLSADHPISSPLARRQATVTQPARGRRPTTSGPSLPVSAPTACSKPVGC